MTATMATMATGTVKYPTRAPMDYSGRLRINAVVTINGEDVKLWGDPNDAIASLVKGQTVTVLWDGKGWKLAEQPTQQLTPPTAANPMGRAIPSGEIPSEMKPAIAAYITQMADLYAFGYSQAKRALPTDTPDAAVQAAASTVFIAAQRKFNV